MAVYNCTVHELYVLQVDAIVYIAGSTYLSGPQACVVTCINYCSNVHSVTHQKIDEFFIICVFEVMASCKVSLDKNKS